MLLGSGRGFRYAIPQDRQRANRKTDGESFEFGASEMDVCSNVSSSLLPHNGHDVASQWTESMSYPQFARSIGSSARTEK